MSKKKVNKLLLIWRLTILALALIKIFELQTGLVKWVGEQKPIKRYAMNLMWKGFVSQWDGR